MATDGIIRSFKDNLDWLVTSQGEALTRSTDYPSEIARGNAEGWEPVLIVGLSESVGSSGTSTIWNQGGNYTYLTSDTTLYISSSSASDTAVTVLGFGLDENYNEITATATTNGQNQVAFSTDFFRAHLFLVISSTSPVGDLYIAESDTLSGGVPTTTSKIKSKIALTGVDAGTPYASHNTTHNGFYTVPAGKTFLGASITANVLKNSTAVGFGGRVKSPTGPWLNRSPADLYESSLTFDIWTRSALPEKYELQFRARADSGTISILFQLQGWIVDN